MNTKQVSAATISKIAAARGLIFEFNKADNCFVMLDRKTRDVIMTYATITVSLISSEKVWREECNKLRVQAFR